MPEEHNREVKGMGSVTTTDEEARTVPSDWRGFYEEGWNLEVWLDNGAVGRKSWYY